MKAISIAGRVASFAMTAAAITTSASASIKPSLHNPVRGADESREDYKARRKTARKAVNRATMAGDYCGNKTGRELHRDAMRNSGAMKKQAGSFGRGLRNAINHKQATQQRARLSKLTAF